MTPFPAVEGGFIMAMGDVIRRSVVAAMLVAAGAGLAEAQEGHRHELGDGGGVAHWLPRLEDPERDEWQKPDHVVELLELEPGMVVVDLGAGTGYFLARLDAAVAPGGKVLALDIDEDLVGYIRERAEREGWKAVEPRVAATDDPRLAPESVDRVLIVNTWHHLGDREAYAGKLTRALKPGGRVTVVDFSPDSPEGPRHRLPAERVITELAAAGLETAVVEEDLPNQYVVVGRRP